MTQKREENADWIFSYSDLMTLLLCFFVLLYATAQIDEESKEKIQEQLSDIFNPVKNEEEVVLDEPERMRDLLFLVYHLLHQNNMT